jgi:cell wall-associated NlpC family hydrolase
MDRKSIGTQALSGQRFDLIRAVQDQAYGALYSVLPGSERIDYIGTVPLSAITAGALNSTHWVNAVVAAIFEAADIKSKLLGSLPRHAKVKGMPVGEFLHLRQGGYIHLKHLLPVGDTAARSYQAIAADMLGLPYIWGGTGFVGVDCSGLVQSALAAVGVDAPRDADQQEAALGQVVDFAERQSGDLLFWPGHVGIVTDVDHLLHANAFHMCVALELVETAVARIGAVRTVKRLSEL